MPSIPSFIALAMLVAACARPQPHAPSAVSDPTWVAPPKDRYLNLGITSSNGMPDLSQVTVEVSRSECYGSCPSYSIELHGTGEAEYTGRAFVVSKGHTLFRFDAARIVPIIDELDRLDFFRMEHHCPMTGSDMQFTTLRVTVNGKTDELTSPWTEGQIPEQLSADDAALHLALSRIADAIDSAGDVYRWIGTISERQTIAR